jgi:hypothetical protein
MPRRDRYPEVGASVNMTMTGPLDPIRVSTDEARSRGMRVLPSPDGSSGSAEPVEELARRMRSLGARSLGARSLGARSLGARSLSRSGAAFAGGLR